MSKRPLDELVPAAEALLKKRPEVRAMGTAERGAEIAPTASTLSRYLTLPQGSPGVAVLRSILELGVRILGVDEGSLLIRDPKTDELVFAMTAGSNVSDRKLSGQRVPMGEGITGLAATERAVHFGAPTYLKVQQAVDGGPDAVMAAPVLVANEVVGVITAVRFGQGKRFNANDAALYAQVAALVGVVISQQRGLSAP